MAASPGLQMARWRRLPCPPYVHWHRHLLLDLVVVLLSAALVVGLARLAMTMPTCGDWDTALQYRWSASLRESLGESHEGQPCSGWRQGAARHNPA
jgi:hypothetical protein